jgi:hypothetical protein
VLDDEIEWSCEVLEGRVTYFDVRPASEPGPPACKLAGQLLFNLTGDWVAGLGPPEQHFIDRGEPVPASAEGRFEVAAQRPGRYRLQLMNRGSFQYVSDLVELVEGTTAWSMDQRHGSLEITGLEPMAEEDDVPGLVHIWRGRGELLIITALMPDENGACDAEFIPIGSGTLAVPDMENLDPETWEVLETVTVHTDLATFVSLR